MAQRKVLNSHIREMHGSVLTLSSVQAISYVLVGRHHNLV